jgi:hypothetical protein
VGEPDGGGGHAHWSTSLLPHAPGVVLGGPRTPCVAIERDGVCVFITAGPSTKLFTWRGGGYGRTCATRDDEPRPVWTRLPAHHALVNAGEREICVKEGRGEEVKCERERALELLRYYSPGH